MINNMIVDKVAVNDEGLLYFEITMESSKDNKEHKGIINFNKCTINGVEYDNTYSIYEHKNFIYNTLSIDEIPEFCLLPDDNNEIYSMTIEGEENEY